MKRKTIKELERSAAATQLHQHEAGGGAGGALVGALVGAIAGPPGIAAGALLGGIVGALAVGALESEHGDDLALDRRLDEEIGVSGGDLGAPNLLHPPAVRGVYSAESAGAAGSDQAPAEGPMQTPET